MMEAAQLCATSAGKQMCILLRAWGQSRLRTTTLCINRSGGILLLEPQFKLTLGPFIIILDVVCVGVCHLHNLLNIPLQQNYLTYFSKYRSAISKYSQIVIQYVQTQFFTESLTYLINKLYLMVRAKLGEKWDSDRDQRGCRLMSFIIDLGII